MEPKDWCTMSVASLGPATLEKPLPKFPNGIERVKEIEQEPVFAKTFTEFRSTFNSTTDIAGASPKRNLSHSRNCFHTLLVVDDIPGTRPREKSKMLQTGRHVDPLQPSYSLPNFPTAEIESPAFLRDSMSVADIDGAQTKKKKTTSVRNLLDTSDIAGAKASWKPRHSRVRVEAAPHDIMNVGIPVKKKQTLSKRVTDPVAPSYFINGTTVFDDPRFTKPTPLKKFIPENHLLQTADISGATAVEDVYKGRREFRNTNFLGDIKGAQADSIKHSIVTNRATNPLNPDYSSLDDGSVLAPPVKSLVPPDIIKVPTVFHKKTSLNATTNDDKITDGSMIEVSSYTNKLSDTNDRIDGKPPPIPLDKMLLSPLNTAERENRKTVENTNGLMSTHQNSARALSVRSSPACSARSHRSADANLSRTSSRTPSMTLSARRALEEKQMEIESVRSLQG